MRAIELFTVSLVLAVTLVPHDPLWDMRNFSVVGAAEPEPGKEDLLKQGRSAIEAGKLGEAIALLTTAIETETPSAEAFEARGAAYSAFSGHRQGRAKI